MGYKDFFITLKILCQQFLEVIDTTRPVHTLGDRGDWKGYLRLNDRKTGVSFLWNGSQLAGTQMKCIGCGEESVGHT